MSERELANAGADRLEALRAAQRALGNDLSARDRARDLWVSPWLQDLWRDIVFATRLMTKDRSFTLAAVIALALGISVNNTVFTIVNAGLLRSLPFDEPDRIVSLGTRDARSQPVAGPPGYRGVSFPELEDWRRGTRAFEGLAAYTDTTMNLGDPARAPERFGGAYVSANTFGLLGQRPVLGRDFTDDDDRVGAAPVVLLGHGVWVNRYGADPALVGRMVRVNSVPSTVVGIMPVGFKFPVDADVWQPMTLLPGLREQTREARALSVVGRLADGVSREQAHADVAAVAARLGRAYPETNREIVPTLTTYDERFVHPVMNLLFMVLMGAVGFVLLIACANVANLLLARSATRAREIAVRVSLGATRWRIVRQLLVESTLLAAWAGCIGFGLSVLALRLFTAAVDVQPGKPYWLDFTMDSTVFAFLAAVCLGTGVLFGLAPALHVSKTDVNGVLKEGGRGSSGGVRGRRWTGALIAGELAMTLVLLAGAGSMMRSFLDLYDVDLGIETSRLTTLRLHLPEQKYGTPEQRVAFYQELDERLSAVPGVQSATIANTVFGNDGLPREIAVEGHQTPAGERPRRIPAVVVGSRYFETLGLRLLSGRPFTFADSTAGQASAIVDERFAALYFPNADPIGRRLRIAFGGSLEASPWLTIVGVSPTVGQRPRDPPRSAQPIVYVPLRTAPLAATTLIVRAERDPGAITQVLREEVRALDGDLPLFDIRTLDQWLAFFRWPQRVFGTMFSIFAGIALVLSAVALYGVIAYSVTQRAQEIGVRMALGARASQVTWLVARRVAACLTIGLMLGVPVSIALIRVLPFGHRDAMTLIPITGLLLLVSIAACAVPARRATRLDPVIALRHA
ncbi:MAG: ABC transporter permease [Vicinamibacterales bacterium]